MCGLAVALPMQLSVLCCAVQATQLGWGPALHDLQLPGWLPLKLQLLSPVAVHGRRICM